MVNHSNILAPVNANDPNSQRRQSRNVSGSLLAQEGLNENIDPEEDGVGGKMAAGGKSEPAHESSDDDGPPEPIVVKKYRARVLEHKEDSTRHGTHFPQTTQSSESGSNIPNGDDSTVISKIQDASADSKSLIPMPTTGSSRRTSRRRAQGSPGKIAASPLAPPSSEQGTPNTSQHLDYQQWLNSDECYDDSVDGNRHEQDECSTRAGRIRGSQADMLGESGFVGGDEASFVSGKDIEFTSDEIEILGEEFSRNSPFARKALLKPLRLPGEVVHESAEHDLSLVSSTPEELPSTPASSRFSNRSHESPAIGSNENTRLDNPHPGTSMGSEKTKHFGKSGSTGRSTGSDTRLTRTEPINPGDDGLNSGSNKSALTRPTNSNRNTAQPPGDHISESVPGSAPQSDPPTAIPPAVKGDSRNSIMQSTSNQSALGLPAQKENSSESSRSESANLGPSTMPRSTPPVADTKAPGQPGPSRDSSPSSGNDPEALSIRLSRSSSPSLGPAEFYQTGGDDPFPETTARNISSFQADFSQSKIYSAALIATSTPRNKYEPDYLTKLKQSGNVRRVSMNTPPSASPKSISATEVLAHSPRFSSLGSGFEFPTEPLRLSNWDSSDASLEFSPILPIDKSSRSSGDEPPPNTANLTPSPHVVDGVVVKDGKGRARSRSVPIDSAKGNAREKRLFDPGRLGGNVPEETRYVSLSIKISNAHECLPITVKNCPCHQAQALHSQLFPP